MTTDLPLWVVTGAVPSVVAPAVLLAVRGASAFERSRISPRVIAPAFVLLHGAVTLSLLRSMPAVLWALLHLLLLLGAMLYWAPVLAPHSTLSGIGKFVYLTFSTPFLDLAGVAVLVLGNTAGGVAMIIAMLPINATALALLWRWMVAEDRLTPGARGAAIGEPPYSAP